MTRLFLLTFLIVMAGINVFGQQAAGCPTIRVVGPDQIVQAGETIFFRVDVEGVAADAPITYYWEVAKADLLDGQGTNLIRVNAPADSAGSNVRATVTVSGLSATCEAVAFEVVGVRALPSCGLSAYEYGDISWEEEKGSLDNLMVQMANNRDFKVFFRISIAPGDTVENARKHVIKIARHFRWRDPDFDPGRLEFGIKKGDEDRSTRYYLLSNSDSPPECDGCTQLHGKNLSL